MTEHACQRERDLILLRWRNTRHKSPKLCRATFFRCKFWVDVSRFSPCVINLSRNKNICCGLKKCSTLIGWFALCKSKTSCKFEEKRAAKPRFIAQSRPALYRVKKAKHWPKTCNETMLRDKLMVFVSCISPPLHKLNLKQRTYSIWQSFIDSPIRVSF